MRKICLPMAVLSICFILINIVYNFKNLNTVLPMNDFCNQQIYQDSNREEGSLPDAYLRALIRNKSVTVPYEISEYIKYDPDTPEEERGASFKQDYYHENNYVRYFSEYAAANVYDSSLPGMYELIDFVESDSFLSRDEFTDMGLANDMLRYLFLVNKEGNQEASYFRYSWFYYSFSNEKQWYPHVYVMQAECEESDELVAIWDRSENLFLTSRDYYNSNLKQEIDDYITVSGKGGDS